MIIKKKNICKTGNTGFKPRITQESIKTFISTVVLLIRERFKLEKNVYREYSVQHRIANNVNIQTSHILYKYLRASDMQ